MASYQEMWAQIVASLKAMSGGQKLAAAILVLVLLGGLLGLTMMGGRLDYRVLYSGLTQEDAAEVVAKLKESRTSYRLAGDGGSILVPAGQVYEVRLAMAGKGLPRGGGVGFEVFDQSSFGTTDFVQRLNYQRALQGELARTIRQFKQVIEARVHIATPKESVFVEDEKPVTASISVRLRNGSSLSRLQIQSIVNLVASAVPGLSSDQVVLVDTTGRLLFRQGGDSGSIMTSTQLEYQQRLEENLRRKVESILEEVVGFNKVKAQVTADLDFSKVKVTEESYDPEGQVVRSEQQLTEQDSRGGADAQGIPGVKGELASFSETGSTSGGTAGGYRRNNVTRNYEVSRTTRQTQEASGAIKRLSVAVMVDGLYERSTDDQGREVVKYIPRSPDDLVWFDKLVKNAIGYNEERADQVEVVNMAFALSSVVEPEPTILEKMREPARQMAMPLFYLVVVFLVIFLVIKPLLRILSTPPPSPVTMAAAPGGTVHAVIEGEPGEVPAHREEDDSLTPRTLTDKERMYRLAQTDPDRAADLVRRWLREEE